MIEFEKLSKEFAAANNDFYYIDCMQIPRCDRDDVFVEDGVHFNQEGYNFYTKFFLEALKDELAEFYFLHIKRSVVMQQKAIVNANVVLETGIIWDGAILVEYGKILKVDKKMNLEIPEDVEIIDAGGKYVGPGFVDIHIHEANIYSTCYKTKEAAGYMLRHGTTSIFPTLSYSLNFEDFICAIKNIKAAMPDAPTVKGMYMEGPYMNPKYGANAHKNPWLHPMDENEYKALVDEAGEYAKVWAIAPEREGIVPFLEYARKVNPETVFAVGHSEATPEQIRRLGKYRPTLQTHSMCATGRTQKELGTRSFGPDEYCFKEKDVYCELISDSVGLHVHSEMQQLLIHNKGIDRVVLITDSTKEDAAAPEEFAHITDINFDDVGGISGSKLTMDKVCRNIMAHTNCGIAQAFIMASTNPAKVVGLYDELGSIEEGKNADFVFVDDKFNVNKVMFEGNICYEEEK